MGKKARRETQKAEEEKNSLATAKAAAAKEAKRVLATEKAEAEKAEAAKDSTLAAAKDAVVQLAEQVTKVVTQAAHAVKEHVVEPVVAVVKKPKKARFVREQTAKKPEVAEAPLPTPSTTAAGKMMSKNVTMRPKEERSSGPKDERATRPKPKS